MKELFSIMTLLAGLVLFGYGTYLVEHESEIVLVNTYNDLTPGVDTDVINLDEMVIHGGVDDVGMTRSRGLASNTKAKPMVHVQSSTDLRWLSSSEAEKALSFGTLREHKVKTPDQKPAKSGADWRLVE